MNYNAADEKQVKDTSKEQETAYNQLLEDYRFLLKNSAGKRFFKHFFNLGGLVKTSFVARNSEIYFNEGRRNFANMIFTEASVADAELACKIHQELILDEYKEDSDE